MPAREFAVTKTAVDRVEPYGCGLPPVAIDGAVLKMEKLGDGNQRACVAGGVRAGASGLIQGLGQMSVASVASSKHVGADSIIRAVSARTRTASSSISSSAWT